MRRSALQWFGRCAVPARGVAILGRQADQQQVQVDLAAAGRKLPVHCNGPNETPTERSGMTLAELDALNREIQALCEALTSDR